MPLSAGLVLMAAVVLTGCAARPTLNKPTCCDQAVRLPSAMGVSGVLLATGGVASIQPATPVSGGIVTFRLETDLGSSAVIVRTARDGEFHLRLAPGVYRVEAALATSPGTLTGSFGPFQIRKGHNPPLRLTLVGL